VTSDKGFLDHGKKTVEMKFKTHSGMPGRKMDIREFWCSRISYSYVCCDVQCV